LATLCSVEIKSHGKMQFHGRCGDWALLLKLSLDEVQSWLWKLLGNSEQHTCMSVLVFMLSVYLSLGAKVLNSADCVHQIYLLGCT